MTARDLDTVTARFVRLLVIFTGYLMRIDRGLRLSRRIKSTRRQVAAGLTLILYLCQYVVTPLISPMVKYQQTSQEVRFNYDKDT